MDNNTDIIDNTLNVLSDSINNFDHTFGKIPFYNSGQALGGLISGLIDALVDSIVTDK